MYRATESGRASATLIGDSKICTIHAIQIGFRSPYAGFQDPAHISVSPETVYL